MAKYDKGYFQFNFKDFKDPKLFGMWSLIGNSVVYDNDYHFIDKAFTTDPIAYKLLTSIICKNANADKVLVRKMFTPNSNLQCIADIQKVLTEATNPELILASNSWFAVILSDADYGMDVWIWDLHFM